MTFHYARPQTLAEVLSLLDTHGPAARVLAGGTDLVVQLRRGEVPAIVIDLKRVNGLGAEIVEVDSCLRIGAGTVMTDLIHDERVRAWFPALVEAAAVVGSVQIRNRATLVGNICNASPAADTAPALLVYGAVANLVSASGVRRVPLAEFFTGPGRTALTRGELVESLDLPRPSAPVGAAFGRLTRRRGVDLAVINLCCLVTAGGETRVACGAVGPRPFLVREDHAGLTSRSALAVAPESMLHRLIAPASPITDLRASREYRSAMLRVFLRRTLQVAIDRLPGAPAGV